MIFFQNSLFFFTAIGELVSSTKPRRMEYYRKDGVRITHDPYHPDMVAKYGQPGETDREGFDPYADSVGPGIYGGVVKRDEAGQVMIGAQYQNHNPRPGPVYAGGGYTPVNAALKDVDSLDSLLRSYPDLVNDVSTGGAQPLHMAGMSRANQDSVQTLVEHGADIEAVDTYGFTPLLRMASNNLARGKTLTLYPDQSPDSPPQEPLSCWRPELIQRTEARRETLPWRWLCSPERWTL